MPKPMKDAIAILDDMLKVLTPDHVLSAAETKRLAVFCDDLAASRTQLDSLLRAAISKVIAQSRILATVSHDLDVMLRTLNWFDSAGKSEKMHGGIVQNAKAMTVMSSRDLRRAVDLQRDASKAVNDSLEELGL